MKDNDLEILLSGLKPAGLTDKTRKSITEALSRLEQKGGKNKSISFPMHFSAVILRAAAAIFVLIGSGILIHRIITRPDNGAVVHREPSTVMTAGTDPAESSIKPGEQLVKAADNLTPISIRTHLLSESDEGIVMTPDGPVRMLRYELVDDYELPAPGGSIIKSVPRQHIILTGINSN